METILFDLKGKESGKVSLPGVFETKVSEGLLHEVVTGILANQRSGTHSTKNRGEVRGGGAKPWKQKGTGRARSGSIRSPLWRKGGIAFGPRPKSYYQNLPDQKRKKALQMALSAKFAGGDFIVIEDFAIDEPKTKKVAEILKNLKIYSNNTLLLLKSPDQKLKRAGRNIEGLVLAEARSINAYQVLWARKILCTKSALEELKNK